MARPKGCKDLKPRRRKRDLEVAIENKIKGIRGDTTELSKFTKSLQFRKSLLVFLQKRGKPYSFRNDWMPDVIGQMEKDGVIIRLGITVSITEKGVAEINA